MAVMMVTGAMAGLPRVLLADVFHQPLRRNDAIGQGMVVALAGGLGSVSGA
jgi:hypothetical protein